MIRKIADLIVTELSGLNFVDHIGGVVKDLEINKTGDVKKISKHPEFDNSKT